MRSCRAFFWVVVSSLVLVRRKDSGDSGEAGGEFVNWSDQQLAIFDWFEAPEGRPGAVVIARAGTGKTTTIMEGVRRFTGGRALVAAFNRSIATELQERAAGFPHVEAKTLHSVGFAAIRRAWAGVRVASGNERAAWLAREVAGEQAPDEILGLVGRLCSAGREQAPFATGPAELEGIALEMELTPSEDWAESGYDLGEVARLAYLAMGRARERAGVALTGVDFSDMLFLPLVNRWIPRSYDLVVIDEAQDMNAAQVAIACQSTRGRLCVVGDDRQAIYGFRGADSGSLGRMAARDGFETFGLTRTYRCGRAIVELAAQLVPDFEAGPNNPAGEVVSLPAVPTEKDAVLAVAQVGDAVLSRKNAPLVPLALAAIRRGMPARIQGKDIAEGLRSLIKRCSAGKARNSVPEMLARLRRWEATECQRLIKAGKEHKIEDIQDRAETIRALTEDATGIPEVLARLETLFAGSSGPCLVLSTVHRAKGLEWGTVYLLESTFRVSGDVEEQNVRYVAITRAKSRLVLVGGARDGKGRMKWRFPSVLAAMRRWAEDFRAAGS